MRLQIRNEVDLDKARTEKSKWSDYNTEFLRRIVDTEDWAKEYHPGFFIASLGRVPFYAMVEEFYSDIRRYINRLESILGRLELVPESPSLSAGLGQLSQREELPQEYLIQLRQILDEHFDENELKTLCFDLDVDYDNLPGEGKASKVRELITYLRRRGRIFELVGTGKRLRPDVPWPEVVDDG